MRQAQRFTEQSPGTLVPIWWRTCTVQQPKIVVFYTWGTGPRNTQKKTKHKLRLVKIYKCWKKKIILARYQALGSVWFVVGRGDVEALCGLISRGGAEGGENGNGVGCSRQDLDIEQRRGARGGGVVGNNAGSEEGEGGGAD